MDPIDLEALRFFATSAGSELLARAAELRAEPLQAHRALRERFPAPLCRAALTLADLRVRAGEKFAAAAHLFFDREGLEMASREAVARHRAARFGGRERVLDLCCGIGGDLMALARQSRVVAVDRDRGRLEMARMNCRVCDLEGVCFVQADVTHLRFSGDAAFLDPMRRQQGGRRSRSSFSCVPPLSLAVQIRRTIADLAIKVSPAIPEEQIPPADEVEFVSDGGQCREGVLYYGGLATARRRATLLPSGHTLVAREGPPVEVAPPGAFLHDPDPAVVRAHLIDELARHLDAWKLDAQIAYLSSDAPPAPTPFARSYRVLCWEKFHLKRLRARLLEGDFYPAEIKKRRFPMEPEELARRLQVRGGSHPVVLVLTRLGGQTLCAICQRVGN